MSIVIIGGGHAAAQVCASLRQEKYVGKILILSEDDHPPYQRPPLSKQFLSGDLDQDRLFLRSSEFYEKQGIELHLGCRVTSVNRGLKMVETESGLKFHYEKLIICTGSRSRQLNIEGSKSDGVHYFRTLDEVKAIRSDMGSGKKLVIVGGGYIGLEVASVAIKLGLKVTIIETEERILKRVASSNLSEFFTQVHVDEGVKICTNASVTRFESEESEAGFKRKLSGVVCGDGKVIEADIAIIGIGIIANTELAAEAGLDCDNGILVTDRCCTSDADIFAVGDCTNHPNALLNRRLRLESIPNVNEQARVAAANIVGKDKKYCSMPWFWSDQYDVKLQMSGFSNEADCSVVRGSVADRQFLIYHFKEDILVGVDSVNSPKEFLASKKLVEQCARDGLKLSKSRVADTSIAIGEI